MCCSSKSIEQLRNLLCSHCRLSFLFLISLATMYYCKSERGLIIVDWSPNMICIVNEITFAFACSYATSFIFYLLTVLYPKAEKSVPILAMAKEDVRYAKDTISDFFMSNNGNHDLDVMSNEKMMNIMATSIDNDFYTIKSKETEWLSLLEAMDLVRDFLQFLKIQSEYLDAPCLNKIKVIENHRRVSYSILCNYRINHKRLNIDISDEEERDSIRNCILKIGREDLTKLVENLRGLYINLDKLHSLL